MALAFDDERSASVLLLLVDKKADDVGRFGKLLFSSNECPSDEPLVISDVGGLTERSLSDIVRESSEVCVES